MEFGALIKTFESKKGNTVTFRYLKSDDLDGMLTYINELIREDTFIEMSGQELTREEEEKFMQETLSKMKKDEVRMVIVEVNGVYAGSGGVEKQTYRKQHVGVVGISLAKAVREEGIGTQLLQTLIEEAKSLGLKLLELNVFENNPRAIRTYKRAGFRTGGIIPNAILYKGNYVGEIKMYLPLG